MSELPGQAEILAAIALARDDLTAGLADRTVEVHRDPEPSSGRYRSIVTATHGSLSPATIPDLKLPLVMVFE